ncbi:MAG: phosphoenolpyruvate carboxykinase (ATP) [Alphaproteobacteria bacterium]|nr:phosphoenolpyruvate carboxykinase (ATP) [Alphaproteobacteria bacterium]
MQRGQAQVLASGALHQETGPYFGRAAKSSFYVNDPEIRIQGRSLDELIAWGDVAAGEFDNLPISPEVFERLHARVLAHLSADGDLYVVDAHSGRTPATQPMGVRHHLPAAGALFSHNIFLRLGPRGAGRLRARLDDPARPRGQGRARRRHPRRRVHHHPPGRRLDHQGHRLQRADQEGHLLRAEPAPPARGHPDDARGRQRGQHRPLRHPRRPLRHGQDHPLQHRPPRRRRPDRRGDPRAEGDAVISNLEGGQYAKTDKLRREKEPETWDAIRFGTTAENLFVLEGDGSVDFDNSQPHGQRPRGLPPGVRRDSAKASATSRALRT